MNAQIKTASPPTPKPSSDAERLERCAREVIAIEARAIAGLGERIDGGFLRACQLMLACKGRVVVSGMGKSGHIARKIAATLASTGTPAFFVHPAEASHGDLGMILDRDVVLALSNSGETDELLTVLPLIKRQGVPLIAMSGNPNSSLAKLADAHLDVSVPEEACPLGLAPTASTTAALVMGDALAVALLEARGFTAEDFARSHPAGSLGRRLLLKIADIMHVGERLPSVRDDASVSDALVEMTRKGLGMTGVIDAEQRLLGIVTMRDLLFSDKAAALRNVMLRDPFALQAATPMMDAMKQVLDRHFPVYPVIDEGRRLVGLVRGQSMFEAQAIEISMQAGSMVGLEKEERLTTPLMRSLKMRHPWLQFNLLTAFLAAAVVGIFQDTLDRLVILALFLPVLAGQSGNTGCQALAVTLRGMTLGEMKPGAARPLVSKETWLGMANGAGVGLMAAIGMYITAVGQHQNQPLMLAFVVFAAMVFSCIASGLSGALVPLTLKRFGFDPATASSIFLTTATDCVSMGMLLLLATILVT